MILNRQDYIQAELTVRQSRPWFGKPFLETGTLSYAPDLEDDVEEAEFPLIDEEVKTAVVEAFEPWEAGVDYGEGKVVRFEGELVRIITPHTSQADWTPSVARSLFSKNLLDSDVLQEWVQPDGAHDAYPMGFEVEYNGRVWKSKHVANVWVPVEGELWELVRVLAGEWEDPVEEGYAAWKPWTSGLNGDLYQVGDRVSHGGKNWEATLGNNHWTPDSGTGWREIP